MLATETKTRVALRNILLATDFSPISEAAFQYAEAVARRFGSKLHAVHVVPPSAYKYVPGGAGEIPWDLDEQEAKKEMEHLDERMKDLPHETTLVRGNITEAVRTLSVAKNADLVVIGTRGRKGLGRVLLGSIAESIFRQSACPVLTVGPKVMTEAPQEIELKRVLFATDLSEESLAAAGHAFSLAQEFQAELVLLHVVKLPLEPLESQGVIIAERERKLHKLFPADAELWCKPECFVMFGDPARSILGFAKEKSADLIVLGVRGAAGKLGLATHVGNAVAHEVVSHAVCPVLTVRG